ncbi:hypothetical protein ABIA03_004397 [Bradyrhizobium yuanmingense]|uniref:Uncharacterized protein n=1 Tax=Bradyrhizobium yuanmingense TaxID=108015 RepID=A0ABV4GCP5_9BRAD
MEYDPGTAVIASTPWETEKGSYPELGSTNELVPKPTSDAASPRHSALVSAHFVPAPVSEMLLELNSSSNVSL